MSAQHIVGLLLENEGTYSFTTRIDKDFDLDVSNLPLPEGQRLGWQLIDCNGWIKWTLEIDAREWGIKEMSPTVTAFDLTLDVEIEQGEADRKSTRLQSSHTCD